MYQIRHSGLSGIFLEEGFRTRFACGNDKEKSNPDAEHRGILSIKKIKEGDNESQAGTCC